MELNVVQLIRFVVGHLNEEGLDVVNTFAIAEGFICNKGSNSVKQAILAIHRTHVV